MPLSEVVGNAGAVVPEHIVSEVPKPNTGVTIGLTVTVNVVVVAQRPASGVNVYDPEAILSTVAGLHVPVIPFEDVPTRAGTVPPSQIDSEGPKENAGVIFGFTVTVKVTGRAHILASGVKVYVPEAWSFTIAGLHVPFIPLSDVFGKAGTVPPAQIVSVAPKLNVGVVFELTVTENVVLVAHCPAVGVNV